MTAKEKAKELIEKFKPNVYCYYGSGMLTDSYDETAAKHYAKECAKIALKEMLNFQEDYFGQDKNCTMFIEEVKTELEKL